MPGKAIKSTNKKGGKRLPGPHTGTESSLNGTISSSLNKKVADKQKEKEKRTKEKSKRAEHDPDVSKLKYLSQPEKVHFLGLTNYFRKRMKFPKLARFTWIGARKESKIARGR